MHLVHHDQFKVSESGGNYDYNMAQKFHTFTQAIWQYPEKILDYINEDNVIRFVQTSAFITSWITQYTSVRNSYSNTKRDLKAKNHAILLQNEQVFKYN
ncbi:hypothetical protein PV328_006234 [Microctonus aethiopoides]|uniref:Uncharacterized protein n=1 Tax=Microctonus aethiopoides TaxID=144406 RepID=A0AA39KTG3_9HYME|nr:hypothetical protein PV328_006234 [Microctonus aethiopoides]